MITLRIAGDPATWVLGVDIPAEELQQELLSQSGPIALEVQVPLKGRLVLSAQSAAHVAVLIPHAGWIPGGAIQSRGVLYVPSTTGPTSDSPGYTLPASFDAAALEADIVTAMTNGTMIAVEVTDGIFHGPLLLNGAVLPFAVICPPA